ncbi:hypothetical protein D9M69_382680 [compost metagenome]
MAKANTSRPQPNSALIGARNKPKPWRMPSDRARIREAPSSTQPAERHGEVILSSFAGRKRLECASTNGEQITPPPPVRQSQLPADRPAQLPPAQASATASNTAHSPSSTSAPAVSPVVPPSRLSRARRSQRNVSSAAANASSAGQPSKAATPA